MANTKAENIDDLQMLLDKAEEAYKQLDLVMENFRTETNKTKEKLLSAIDKTKIAKVRQSLNKK